jgi:hypothetical protein
VRKLFKKLAWRLDLSKKVTVLICTVDGPAVPYRPLLTCRRTRRKAWFERTATDRLTARGEHVRRLAGAAHCLITASYFVWKGSGQSTPQNRQPQAERHIPSFGVRRRMMHDWVYRTTNMVKGIHHGSRGSLIGILAPAKHGMRSGGAPDTLRIHFPSLHHELLRDRSNSRGIGLSERQIISGINEALSKTHRSHSEVASTTTCALSKSLLSSKKYLAFIGLHASSSPAAQ